MVYKTQITFDLERALFDALSAWADQEGRSRSNLIRRILGAAVERRAKQRQQAAGRKAA